MSTTTDTEQGKMQGEVTAAEEVVRSRCPGCGCELERVIPAGTPEFVARWGRSMQFTCSECSAAEEAEERAEERVRIRHQHEQACQIPSALRRLSWDSYDVSRPGAESAKAAALAWSRGEAEKRGLLLVGPVGVGKTRLAATAAWAALGDFKRERRGVSHEDDDELVPGIPVRYVNVAELIVKVSAGFGDRDRAEALRILTGRGAVVLDDVDKIHPSMFVLSNLYTAIDGRVQSGAPMIVTTNLEPRALREKLARPGRGDDEEQRAVTADAIVSRLMGHCAGFVIGGKDGRW